MSTTLDLTGLVVRGKHQTFVAQHSRCCILHHLQPLSRCHYSSTRKSIFPQQHHSSLPLRLTSPMVWSPERNPAGWAERRKAGLASRGPSSNRSRVKTCVTGCNSLSRITVRQASPLLAHLPPSISTGVAHPKLPKWRTSRYRRPTRMAVPPFEHSTHPLTSAFTWDTIFPWPADEHRQKTRLRSHRSPHHALCNHHPAARRMAFNVSPSDAALRPSRSAAARGDAPLPVRSQSLTFLAWSLEPRIC